MIFHLAAVVSGEAEADLEKGYRVNLDGTRALFDAVRKSNAGYRPRVVFASSIAVFGEPFPDVIGDDHCTTQLTSYGTQKAMGELLLSDYGRRGFLDGIGLRLPTICVRPGPPNRAASGFFSSIIREPLNGEEAVLPVPDHVRHWFASPRAAVSFLVRAATLDRAEVGTRCCSPCPASPQQWPTRSMRCVASRVRTSPASSGASRTRRRCTSSQAGRRRSTHAGRSSSASVPSPTSTRSSASYIDDELGALPSVETAAHEEGPR